MKIVQGWDTSTSVKGWRGDMQLAETDGGLYLITLTQQFQLHDRGTAEIMAAVLRSEGEEHKKAKWEAWTPRRITWLNSVRGDE